MNTNESGRSMVEMLGVLAIIGVLSIGGIAGYTTAMNKYRANEVAQAVAMTVIQAKTRGGTTAVKYTEAIGDLPSAVSTVASEITATPTGTGDTGTFSVGWTNTSAGSALAKAFGAVMSNNKIGDYSCSGVCS